MPVSVSVDSSWGRNGVVCSSSAVVVVWLALTLILTFGFSLEVVCRDSHQQRTGLVPIAIAIRSDGVRRLVDSSRPRGDRRGWCHEDQDPKDPIVRRD